MLYPLELLQVMDTKDNDISLRLALLANSTDQQMLAVSENKCLDWGQSL